MNSHVLVEVSNGVMTLTLARPEKTNALSEAMYSALADALEHSETDSSVRVVLFLGEGEHFTAGNDLGDFAKVATDDTNGERPVFRFIKGLGRASKPLIAGVQGNAVGIGTTMLLHCDLVYLAATARLSAPFVNLALVPEAASSLLLPARIGHARAFAIFALGQTVDAQAALSMGIANAVVPAADLRAHAWAAAETLAKKPAAALAKTKELMRDPARIARQMACEGELFSQQLKTAEAKEAFAAFRERRPPDFSKLTS
jgi:enoyl-CoA hydratase/carnithine racemase